MTCLGLFVAVALENVTLSQQMEYYLFFSCNNCLLVVQQGNKYVILAPVHLYKNNDVC